MSHVEKYSEKPLLYINDIDSFWDSTKQASL